MNKEVFLTLYKNEYMWLILGSLISADNNMTNEEREGNIAVLRDIETLCSDNEVIKEVKDYKKIKTLCKRGIKMLKKEIKENLKTNPKIEKT